MKNAFVDFDKFSLEEIVADRDEIQRINPHRFEFSLLDGILYLTDDYAVGYKDVTDTDFWVRGHFPERPLMPGVLICESAAQLSSYFAIKNEMVSEGYVGLGGLESIRYRGQVLPGNKLILMLKKGKVRKNRMFTADFQAFVDETLVADGTIKGVALGT